MKSHKAGKIRDLQAIVNDGAAIDGAVRRATRAAAKRAAATPSPKRRRSRKAA